MHRRRHDRSLTTSRHFLFVVLTALSTLVVAICPASAKELEDRDWIEIRTSNFRIRSVLSEKDSIELARYLELFHAAASLVTNTSRLGSPIPLDVYALRGSRDFDALGIPAGVGGFFRPGLRSNLIVIGDFGGSSGTIVAMHEYVHFLVDNHGSLNYPRWFHEGFAVYLSAARTYSKKFELGGVPQGLREYYSRSSFYRSRSIPIRKILSPDDEDWQSDTFKFNFYAKAWALVHYLQNRPDRDAPFRLEMARYVELVESGMSDIEAFEGAFGIATDDLDRAVQRYIGGQIPVYRLVIDELLPEFEPEVVSLSREQISLSLGKTALQLGWLDDRAKHWFTQALADESTRAKAEAGIGDVLKFGGDFEAALPHFENAVALAPDDPYCQLDIAEYWHDRAKHSNDEGNRDEYLARARERYVKAWKLDESIPETYAMYADTFIFEARRYDFAIELLEQAERMLPASLIVRLLLAEAYLGANRTDDAAAHARSVVAWSHEETEGAKRAQEILLELKSEAE